MGEKEKTPTERQPVEEGAVERAKELLAAYQEDPVLSSFDTFLRESGQQHGPTIVVTPRWQYSLSCR